MANLVQLRKLEDLSGFLPVDKPVGIAFSSVVKAVKRNFNLVKVGHGGSLDASASGLLVLIVGEANKFVGEVMGADRAYSGTMRLGVKSNTHDLQGELSLGSDNAPGAEQIANALKNCRGDIFQTEPRFCAVRKEGSAGYSVADTGEHAQFLAHVYRFEVGEVERLGGEEKAGWGRLSFELRATKGALVRTLVNDFGDHLGCGAALESCRRTLVGGFSVDAAIPFEKLLTLAPADLADLVIPVSRWHR